MSKQNQRTTVTANRMAARRGFTLIEVLTVIVIIGILAAITVPAVGIALRRAKSAAIRAEIDVIGQALAAYKLDYGDNPPDFYDWSQTERHFRKAFPDIDDNELRILSQFTHYNNMFQRVGEAGGPADPRLPVNGFDHYPHAIDRAEALVFCLGGFSADKKRPFTGPGGPLVKRTDAAAAEPDGTNDDYLAYQYNTEREIGKFDFDINQLSTALIDDGAFAPFAYSNDENPDFDAAADIPVLQNGNELDIAYYSDPFPTYRSGASELPVVYFSSATYNAAWGYDTSALAWDGGGNEHHSQNLYLPNGDLEDTGVARPYFTDQIDTTPPTTILGMAVAAAQVFQPVEANDFQLISAGLDSNFGGLADQTWGAAAEPICIYPTGGYFNPFAAAPSSTTKYQDDLQDGSSRYGSQPQLDNITNFSTTTLEADLP